jgi:hypothetical protein
MGSKKCVLCSETIDEEFGKLNGTLLKIINDKKKREFIPVCSKCQKQEGWIDKARNKSL